jgi:type III secretion protein L
MRLAAQLKDGGLRLVPERRVIKAAEVTAVRDARTLLDEAAAEADRIREAARAAYVEEKQRGYQDGLAEGHDKFAAELLELTAQGSRLISEFESELPEIVMSALRQILGGYDDTELVIQTVKQAMRMFRNQTDVTLRVPPDRLEDVTARIDEMRRDSGASSTYVNVVADRRLGPGGCVLESEFGSVDASIEAQLAVLERAMRKDLASRVGGAASVEPGGND